MDHLPTADVDGHVVDGVVEEDQIAGLESRARDGPPVPDCMRLEWGRLDASLGETYMTNPEQSKPLGLDPAQT